MKVATYGEANDEVPDDELYTALLIQNAAARGLRSCKSAQYETKRGLNPEKYTRSVVKCCAIGAANLSKDTEWLSARGLSDGNDDEEGGGTHADPADWRYRWYDTGAAFEDALR